MGVMEKKMETLGPFKGLYRGYIGAGLGFRIFFSFRAFWGLMWGYIGFSW